MVSIWKSKKGGIPAINEIVMTILNVTPKPILFLIFILLITTIATFVMPLLLNMFGYECLYENNQLVLYQVPMSAFAQKSIADVQQGIRGFFGFEDYKLPDDPYPNNDKRYLRIPPECIDNDFVNGSQMEGYTSACVDCVASSWFRYSNSICLSDGFYDPNLITKYWIGTANFCYKCAPPEPYYYNHFNCMNTNYCYFTITNVSLLPQVTDDYTYDYYLKNVKKLGGVKRSQADDFINIKCTAYNRPSLYFYSMEVFSRTLWIILGVGYFLIVFAYMYYGMVLK